LGKQGCQWVRDHFTWGKIAESQAEVYNAVLAQTRANNRKA
jgi:hypothetical protein